MRRIILLVAFIFLLGFSIYGFIEINNLIEEAHYKLQEFQQTEAFAVGFLYGQRSVITAAGLPIVLGPLPKGSKEIRTIASKHGFYLADKDTGEEE